MVIRGERGARVRGGDDGGKQMRFPKEQIKSTRRCVSLDTGDLSINAHRLAGHSVSGSFG